MKIFTPHKREIDSSAIKEVSYERRRRRLVVRFRSGDLYEYGLVEPKTFRKFVHSGSAGRFFVHQIRNEYPFRKIS